MGKKIQCIGRYVMDCQTLGKGNFARVELATHSVTGCKVAIKIIDTRKIKEDYVRQNLHREARILGQLRHPNIIRLYETLKPDLPMGESWAGQMDPGQDPSFSDFLFREAAQNEEPIVLQRCGRATTLYCLVLECAAGGDLQSYIKQMEKKYLSEDVARGYLRQLVSAVHYLHERGVAHRDLKMENIMLDEKRKNVKIVDFGLSNTFDSDELMKTHCGSLDYAAPELFSNEKYGPEVDIWSLGVITYAMVVGKLPFTTPYTDQYRKTKLQQQIKKGLCEAQEREMVHLSEDCKQLLKKLLEPDASLRLPLMDVEIHTWITHDAKMPFYPFHAFPRDKSIKSQDALIQEIENEVISELAEMLSVNTDQIEKTVQENKCDDISAMFNMMMDTKRVEKGIYEIDYTLYQERKREAREKQRKKGASKHEKDSANKASNTATTSNNIPSSNKQDGDSTSMTEAERLQAEHEHKVATNFDFMALCSAPNWLGTERRRSRRRRNAYVPPVSPFPQNTDSAQISTETLTVSQGTPDNPNLLSPNQAAVQIPFNRRSRRRRSSKWKQRSSSYGPTSRKSMLQQEHLEAGSNSQPNSPTAVLNPSIRIDPPKTSPVSRPDKLGIQGCYENETVTLHVPDIKPRHHSNSESEQLDYSDVSNPNSASDIHSSIDGSTDNLSGSCKDSPRCDWTDSGSFLPTADIKMYLEDFQSQGKKSKPRLKDAQQDSVEAKIASADIRKIVKPKQRLARSNDMRCNLLSTNLNDNVDFSEKGATSTQVDIFPETTMQKGEQSLHGRKFEGQACGSDADIIFIDESVDDVNLCLSDIHLSDLESSGWQSESQKELLATGPLLPAMEIIQPVEVIRTRCGNPLRIDGDSPEGRDTRGNDRNLVVSSAYAIQRENVGSIDKVPDSKLRNKSNYATSDSYEAGLTQASPTKSINDNKILKNDISAPQSLDLNLKFPRNKVQKRNSLKPSDQGGSDTLCRACSEDKSNEPEDKLSPLTPVDSYSKHLYKFSMPSTPLFKTPLARIESFHSDDFEAVTSTSNVESTLQSNATTPSSCSHTPSLSCFAYKLHLHKKKNAKLKSQKSAKSDISSEKPRTKYATEDSAVVDLETEQRQEPSSADALLTSSGSDVGIDRPEDGAEKAPCVSKAKVHPMGKDDPETEMLILGTKISSAVQKSKCNESASNDLKAKKPQMTKDKINKQSESKKISTWKHGFVQFLKKRRQSPSHRSRNNNDSIRSNQYSTTRNGHTRTSYSKALMRSSQDESSGEIETHFNTSSHPTYSDALEVCSSPVSGHTPPPGTTKMFDFTVITSDSPPSKSCLLNWKGCRECTFSDDQNSDEGENECTYRFEQSVDVAIKTSLNIKNVQDAKAYAAYKYAHS